MTPEAKKNLIDKIKKDMAKVYDIKTTAIKFQPLALVEELKFVGFTVQGLKEGFGREYEKIFKVPAPGGIRGNAGGGENGFDPVIFEV